LPVFVISAAGGRCYFRHFFPLDPARVAPQIFQTIERAFVAMEHVDNYLEIIQHDPLTGRETIDGRGAHGVIFFQPRFNFTGDRLEMGLGCRRANDKVIRESGNLPEIQYDNFLGLFVRGELGAGGR
jgi:hypothetical protein